jgi:Zinc knuckle
VRVRTSPGTQVKPPFYKPSSTNAATPYTNTRCFNCNQVGHTRQQCPSRAQGNSSYSPRKAITSAHVQAYPTDETSEVFVRPMTSDFGHGDRRNDDVIDTHDDLEREGMGPRLVSMAPTNAVGIDF